MEEPPWGYRRPEDEPLFKQRTSDSTIVPDYVSPAVEGYFRIPAVWIGDAPDPVTVRILNPPIHHAVVLRKNLRCGIEVRVRRDGTFLFDFSSWPLAPIVVIPGYRIPDPHKSYRVPLEHTREEARAEAYAVLRAQVMNAHQACLTTSETAVKKRTAMMGFPVTTQNTKKAITFDTPPSYADDIEDMHALAQNVLNNKDRVTRNLPLPRRVLELDVVEHSLDLLDSILSVGDAILIQIVEGAYLAACRQREKRFGEAMTLAWGVCEQLISSVWKKLLEEAKRSGGIADRIPKIRNDKLTGPDYTASVMVEMLEINGRIDHELYRLLEVARKARNKWAHEMRVPKEIEVHFCNQAVARLLRQVVGVQLWLQSGGSSAVPEWPIWMWEQVKSQGGP